MTSREDKHRRAKGETTPTTMPPDLLDEEAEIMERSLEALHVGTMEMGRRHGLGDRALEYAGLPEPERRERLEGLMDFIHEANARRVRQGENPNTFQDLRHEYDPRQAKG